MRTSEIESTAKRCLAVVVGLVIGLVVGLIGGSLLIGFGDPLLVTVCAVALAAAISAWRWPAPYLTVAGIVLGVIGINV